MSEELDYPVAGDQSNNAPTMQQCQDTRVVTEPDGCDL